MTQREAEGKYASRIELEMDESEWGRIFDSGFCVILNNSKNVYLIQGEQSAAVLMNQSVSKI